MTSASAVMKVFITGLRRRLTFTVPALAEIERRSNSHPFERSSNGIYPGGSAPCRAGEMIEYGVEAILLSAGCGGCCVRERGVL